MRTKPIFLRQFYSQVKTHPIRFGWLIVSILAMANISIMAAISIHLNQHPRYQTIAIPTAQPTKPLPTTQPTASPTPQLITPSLNTTVGAVSEPEEPTVSPSVTPTPIAGDSAIVSRVIDGDTVELSAGQKVRYIGIDTPESVDPRKPVQCFAEQASAENKALVEGKTVTLVKDVSDKDKYGRLLRYVYVEGMLVNDYLIRHGYARLLTIPPDVAMADQFRSDQQLAQQEQLGLWSIC